MSQTPPTDPTNEETPTTAPASKPVPERAQRESTWGGFFLFLTQRVFLYFVLYALSIGPFYWQWYGSRFVGGSSIIAAFYQPLVILAEWVPPFGEWMDWYVGFWIA